MTLRVTRLLTTDALGQWLVGQPARRWARGKDPDAWEPDPDDPGALQPSGRMWRTRLVSALSCPFCVGTHVGFAVLASRALAERGGPRTLAAWRAVAGGLALNYVVGHVSARLD